MPHLDHPIHNRMIYLDCVESSFGIGKDQFSITTELFFDNEEQLFYKFLHRTGSPAVAYKAGMPK